MCRPECLLLSLHSPFRGKWGCMHCIGEGTSTERVSTLTWAMPLGRKQATQPWVCLSLQPGSIILTITVITLFPCHYIHCYSSEPEIPHRFKKK